MVGHSPAPGGTIFGQLIRCFMYTKLWKMVHVCETQENVYLLNTRDYVDCHNNILCFVGQTSRELARPK